MLKSKSLIFILLLLIFIAFPLSGCSLKFSLSPKTVPTSDLSPEALIMDNAIYDRTYALINSAQSSIYLEQAEFDDPRLIDLLLSKAASGVDVRILLDQWQKVNKATLDELKGQNSPNLSVQFYPAQKGQYDHIKLLIIDQRYALINGPSWTSSGFQTHDLAVELAGKSAWKAASILSKDWEFTTTFPLSVPTKSSLPEDNNILATNANVKQQLSELISSSTKSIWIENPELTDPDLKQALIDATKKGRDVRLILKKDMATENPVTVEDLKANKIQIRYYPDQPSLGIHLAIFDNASFLLSSSEWTRISFVTNHELSITVPSPTASAKLGEMFTQDWDKSSQ